jgi:signal transduction histidine kinase
MTVRDDGRGGAVPRPGGGLDGLRRRLAAFDGSLVVDSPRGGPTLVEVTVPCGS